MVVEHGTWRVPGMNRYLVERVTHTEALDALTASLAVADSRWQERRQNIDGNALADAQIAPTRSCRGPKASVRMNSPFKAKARTAAIWNETWGRRT